MEHITQLTTIRDEALNRLQTNPDYRLLTSLDQLIIEVEGVIATANLADKNTTKDTFIKPNAVNHEAKPTQSIEQAFDKLNIDKKLNSSGNNITELADEVNGGISLS